jgi:hypothetical protein
MSADFPRGKIILGKIVSIGFSGDTLGHFRVSCEIVPLATFLTNHTGFPRVSKPFLMVFGLRKLDDCSSESKTKVALPLFRLLGGGQKMRMKFWIFNII